MQLVNRFFIYSFLIVIFFFTGCSITSKNLSNDENFVKKEYKNISKDAILEAAKKAFIFSGDGVFLIDSYRNSLYVTRTKMVHYPLYAKTYEDRWNLFVEEKDNSSFVKLSLKRVHEHDEKDVSYFHKDVNKLLLSRMEYFLGMRELWLSCDFYHSYTSFENALCDSIDLKVIREPNKYDIISNILIKDRSKNDFNSNTNDILNEDIVLTLDEEKVDILDKNESKEESSSEEKLEELDELDLEILKLDKKVSDNIDETLEKIENDSEN